MKRSARLVWAGAVCAAAVALVQVGIRTEASPRPGEPPLRTLRLGLLTPTRGPRVVEGREVRRGAEAAVADANRAQRGLRLELVSRHDDGLWGAGVREVVRLASTDRVTALIGGVDSESAHVIQQVAQKWRLVYMMPWTSDRTLTQAGVPWAFSCVPNDGQQARDLARRTAGVRHVAVLHAEDRSSRLSAASFIKVMAALRRPIPASLRWSAGDKRPGTPDPLSAVSASVQRERPDVVVLYAPQSVRHGMVGALRRVGGRPQVMEPHVPMARRHPFHEAYRVRYGSPAPAPAALAYDAVMAIARALERIPASSRRDREALRRAVATGRWQGATGVLRFDRRGNRICP